MLTLYSGFVDGTTTRPGTTLILIATDTLVNYQSTIGAVLDNTVGLLRLTPTHFNNPQSLFFIVGSVSDLMPLFIHIPISHANQKKPQTTFKLTANAQAWSCSLNSLISDIPSYAFTPLSPAFCPCLPASPLFCLFFFGVEILTLHLVTAMVI